MGWENRNGKQYFYRKVRVGNKVRSEYWGCREEAELIHELVAGDPIGRALDREVARSRRDDEDSLVRRIATNEREIMRFVTEGLAACGFRQHKGQWRKRRDED